MCQFIGRRLFETENFATLRIDTGQYMLDGAVLSGSVHALKYQQQGIPTGGIEQGLFGAQFPDMFTEYFLILFLRLVYGYYLGRPFFKLDRFTCSHLKIIGIDIHFYPLSKILARVRPSEVPSFWQSTIIFICRLVKYQCLFNRVGILGDFDWLCRGLRGDDCRTQMLYIIYHQ